jgi:hypothetical protein
MGENDPPTLSRRPVPNRPPNGLIAWQFTLGYISNYHSPDAMLKLQAYPVGNDVSRWSGTVSWAQVGETIRDAETLADLLRLLWLEVDRNHLIFDSQEDANRRPLGYKDNEWLDLTTQNILHRLLWTVQSAFDDDWRVVIVYQPAEIPAQRVQTRLISTKHQVGGRGASMAEALRDCFRNAVPAFATQMEDDTEEN